MTCGQDLDMEAPRSHHDALVFREHVSEGNDHPPGDPELCVSMFQTQEGQTLNGKGGGCIFWPDGEGGSISRSYCDTQASRPLMSSQQQAEGVGGPGGDFTAETQVLQMGSPPIQAAACRRGEMFGSPQDKPRNVRE